MWKFKISKRNDEIIKLIKDGTIEVADKRKEIMKQFLLMAVM